MSAASDAVRRARVALTWLLEPGDRVVWHLVERYGPVEALARLLTAKARDESTHTAVAARLAAGDPYRVAEDALRRAEQLGARLVVPEDSEWPPALADLSTLEAGGTARGVERDTLPPQCLWVRGRLPLDEALDRSVAVVGARAATAYGTQVATELGYGLAERDWTIVSGGAYGIDAAAHRGALTAGGVTVAVLACGVDRAYPMGNSSLFDRILDTGLLISEWPPGADPLRHRFLIRNRVIAAATRGTVVVEASARSGATQTLRRAAMLPGRAVMAVPGPVTSAMSVGCHEVLRDCERARLVTGTAQVLEEVGQIGEDLAAPARGPEHPRDALDPEAARILEALPRTGRYGIEELAARAGVDVRTTLRQVGLLVEKDLVIRHDGRYGLARGALARGAARGSNRDRITRSGLTRDDQASTVD